MNRNTKNKKTAKWVLLLVCAALVITAAAWLLIPQPLVPGKFASVTCSVMDHNLKQIFPTDDQTLQLAKLLRQYRITPTLKQYRDIILRYEFRTVLAVHGVSGKKSTQIAGVTVFISDDGEYLYYAQASGLLKGIAYKIHNGQQLYEEIKTMLNGWK